MDNLTGQSLKGYELLERIGSGGFGAVYRAYQTTIGREVAVKAILPGYANRPDFIRRFEAEAQLIARLEHLHIVPLYDYWRQPGNAYLVMRWLRGGSARDALGAGPFGLESAALLLDQISAALAVAHDAGVVHRDLKPSNMLLDEEGNAYLADFGIAADLRRGNGNGLEGEASIGSPAYLAPEQVRGESVTPQTDIYSLGITLYELLSATHPFGDRNKVELLYQQINEPLPPLTTLEGGVGEEVNAVIQRATDKDPRQRYDDAPSMAVAFRKAARLKERQAEELAALLTEREQEVLRLIVAGLSNRQIAQALFVEHSTVKWHIRQVYGKLDVRGRRQAVARAQEMQLAARQTAGPETEATGAIIPLPAPVNPYKGLRAFTAADRADFFGREALLGRLLQRLQLPSARRRADVDLSTGRFLAIVGPSGSGKSSLVRAGLVPALWAGQLPGSDRWYVVEMTPGEHPLAELEVALMRVAADQAGNLHELLTRDANGLVRAAQLILPRDESELALVIDQFEELFSLVDDEEERSFFLGLLATAVTAQRGRVRVILTLRADYYDRPLHYHDFGQLVRRHMETVLPLKAEELERAIVRPVESLGVVYEPGLVPAIIDDVLYQPGALPLLQYALTELFEARADRALTHQAYAEIGGATGALARRAEELYLEQDEAGRELIRQLFLRLISVSREDDAMPDTRRRVPLSELMALDTDEDLLDEVIDIFAAYRLLTLDHNPATRRPTVEVAHEALLREWDRLRAWLNESRADIRRQRGLARAASEWREAKQDDSFLLRGVRLEQFQRWRETTQLALTQREVAYLDASLEMETQSRQRSAQQARAQRNLRRALVGALGLGFVVAVTLAIFAFSRQRAAEASEQEALRQASIGLAAQAIAQLESDAPETGVLLALAALEEYPYTAQAESALAQTVYGTHHYATFQSVSRVAAFEFSPDGALIVGHGLVWDSISGEIIAELSPFAGVSFDWLSAGGRFLAANTILNNISVWEVVTGRERVLHRYDAVNTVYASADEHLALSASGNGTARIWLVESGETVQSFLGHEGGVNDAIWSPDERIVATASDDGTIRLWDVGTGAEMKQIAAHLGGVTALSWSSDGVSLASSGRDGLARLWDANSGEITHTLIGHDAEVRDIEWSPDDSLLATAGGDGRVRIWEPRSGIQLFALAGAGAEVTHISWSPDGQRLAVGDGSTRPRVWDVSTPIVRLVGYEAGIGGNVMTVGPYWSPDSTWVGAGGNGAEYRLWDSVTGENIKTFEQSPAFAGPNPAGTESFLANPPRLVNLETGEERSLVLPFTVVLSPPTLNSTVIDVEWEWSPDASLIFLGAQNLPSYWIYDAETLELLFTGRKRNCGWYAQGRFSPDNAYLAHTCFSSDFPSVHITESLTGEVVKELVGHTDGTFYARWSPDGTKLATTSLDLTVRVWDVETGETLTVFTGHTAYPIDVDWSPDGSRLVSGDAAGVVLVWDAESGAVVSRYNVGGEAFGSKWSPDGGRVLTTGAFDAPEIRPVWQSTEELVEYAYDCCVFRQLTAEERAQFGLSVK